MSALVDDIATLVRVESPSSDPSALEHSASTLAGLGEERLGTPAEVLVDDGVPHLRWRLGTGPRRVLLLGHHDTVWPLGTLAEMPFAVTDGVMRGPGCFDMKAGIVLAIHAIADLARDDPAAVDGVTLLVTGDEEVGSTTSRDLIESEAADHEAVLVCEPGMADGAVKVARKGVSLYTVTAHGHAAHAGLDPEQGVNALVELAHQVPRIDALDDPESGTTVTPTLATAGTTVNTVPDRATVQVDVRVATDAEQARVDAAMHALTPVLDGARLEVAGGANRPPMAPTTGAGLASLAVGVAERLGIGPLPTRAVGGASDGNFTAGIGVPTLDGLGPAGAGAHARDEHVLVDSLVPRRRLLTGLLEELLS
ncbi:M20 family metallopeptidase [Nitriliruptoria bacterium AS10]|nr:M20 family metallopeptidase [Salsipaludibacter albus]